MEKERADRAYELIELPTLSSQPQNVDTCRRLAYRPRLREAADERKKAHSEERKVKTLVEAKNIWGGTKRCL